MFKALLIFVVLAVSITSSYGKKNQYIINDSIEIKYVNKLNDSGYNLRNNEPTISRNLYFTALKESKKIGYKYGEATSLKHLGFYYRYQWIRDSAGYYTEAAYAIFKMLNAQVEQIECKYNRSITYLYSGEFYKAIELCQASLDDVEKLNSVDGKDLEREQNKWRILHLVQIGNIYSTAKEIKLARKFLDSALEIAGRRNPPDSFRAYQSLGETAEQAGKWDSAFFWYDAGLQYSQKQKKTHLILYLANQLNIANALAELNRIAESHKIIDTVLKIILRKPDFYGYSSWANYILTKLYIKEGKLDSALVTGKQCEIERRNMGPVSYSGLIKFLLADIYAKKTFYDSAYYYQTQYLRFVNLNKETENIKKWLIATSEKEARQANFQREIEQQANRQKTLILYCVGMFLLILCTALSMLYKQKKRIDKLLLNILPAEIVKEHNINIKKAINKRVKPKEYQHVTILFTDFIDFTKTSADIPPDVLVNTLNDYFSEFDSIIEKLGLEKIKTIGDAYMAAGGIPQPDEDNHFKMAEAALQINESVKKINELKSINSELYFEIRIGMHTGEVIAGVIGTKKFAYDVWGATVNMASRLEHGSKNGKINISQYTYELIKERFSCSFNGIFIAKGFGEVPMYFLDGVK